MRAVLVALALAAVGACAPGDAEPSAARPVVVFAAASMTDAVDAAARDFTDRTGRRVVTSFAATSTLARQIEAGAPADIFIAADQQWMDALAQAGRIDSATRTDLASNRLALVARAPGRPVAFEPGAAGALTGRIAIADPAHVPAGRYAREALVALDWWDDLSGRLVTAPDVRAALRLVEIGEADFGFVYATDAARSERVSVVGVVPASLHTPIRYSGAVCMGAADDAAALLGFLAGPEGAAHIRAAGFETPAGGAP